MRVEIVQPVKANAPKVAADFKAALAVGDCVFPAEPFPKAILEKAKALGIDVPQR
jgi:hypothetical protein